MHNTVAFRMPFFYCLLYTTIKIKIYKTTVLSLVLISLWSVACYMKGKFLAEDILQEVSAEGVCNTV